MTRHTVFLPEDANLTRNGSDFDRSADRNIAISAKRSRRFGRKAVATVAAGALAALPGTPANAVPVPTASTLVSVCSGVSLPPSVVTGIIDPIVTGIYGPIETNVNGTLGTLTGLFGGLFPAPLSVDVNGLLTTAASGSDIGLNVLSANGTIVGPSDQCDATADSFTLDTPAGVAIGGNQITGLGATGQQAVAGEIDSIAIGNRATTAASALGSIAIGTDASVGAGAVGSVAIGDGASATGTNSVALGAGTVASRANVVDVGGRQISGVAAGTQPTDAVNLGQLTAATQNAVQYDDASRTVVTFGGAGGTLLTNVRAGAVNATSTDAVNGSQLFGVQTQVDANTTAISNLQTTVGGNTTAITNLQTQVAGNTTAITNLNTQVGANTTAITNLQVQVQNGGIGPVQYSNDATPTVPNGGVPTNDLTLVGAAPGPVQLHNVANGVVAAGSTDAVNGGQLFSAISGAVSNAVTYDDSSRTTVTLNSGGSATVVRNVAAGTAATDAVNVSQLNASTTNILNQANSYTDLQFDLLDSQLRRNRSDARSGTSAALAAAALPQAMGEGRTMISGGVGTYGGKVGFAVGASHRASNGKSVYRVGITYDSAEKVGANAGVGVEF